MNNPSDSFQLDEHLARLLAAYEQGVDGGDASAPTLNVPRLGPLPGERAVTPFSGGAANVGSLGEVIPGPAAPDSSPPPPLPLPGTGGTHRIGRFELRRQLGKGGCGIVFLAYDPKLEREVALKIPRPEMLLSPDARRRLVREALAAAEFDHANLVPVYETGEIGPVCYIATAFCPGQTLGEWLDRQAFPVPVRQAARLVATVAEAVQHAHDRGVLHRDLKPNNVILQATKDDPDEQEPPPGSVQLRGEHYVPRVVDFGLAKLMERGGPSETTTRQILGTPKYMAPEQAQARHDDVGPAADVYALGVILYELLTGRAPYEGATDVEVLRLAIEGNLTAPRRVRADIPRDLEAICLKAMDPVPGRRYRTAIDLADDLRRFLDDKPTIARPLKWAGRAARWLRRNDQAVALGVVTTIATVLLAVGSWSLMQTRQLKSDALRDQAARNRSDQQRDYARGVRSAFLAWRAGDARAAAEYLESARRVAMMSGDATDFAHEYLARLIAADRLMIVCPAGPVTALAVSADGKRLASGHADGTITVWDRGTGAQLGSVPRASGEVTHLVFAHGGTRLLSADGVLARSWTVGPDGSLTPTDPRGGGLGSDVTCLAVTGDGRSVYAGNRHGEVYRIDPSDSVVAGPVVVAKDDRITAVSVSGNGHHVLLGTGSGKVVRLNGTLTGHETWEGRLPLSALGPPDEAGAGVILGFATGGLLEWPAGADRKTPPADTAPVHWLVPTALGCAGDWGDGRVRFGTGGGAILPTGDAGAVRAGAASADGKTLFTGSDDGIIRSWQLPGDVRLFGVQGVRDLASAGVDPDGVRVAVATRTEVSDYQPTERGPGWVFPGRDPLAVRVPKDGPAVVAHLHERVVFLRHARRDAKPVAFAPPDGSAATAADLNPEGDRLAVGDDRGRVFVWDVADRTLLATIECGHRRAVQRVALSADGKSVAAPVTDGVGVWTVAESKPVANVPTEDPVVFKLLPAGDRLVTSGRSGVVRVWAVPGGREELTLHGHVGRVTGLGASPDGRNLATGGATGEVKLWDLRTGQELIGYRRHAGPVTVVEFSANGRALVTAGSQLALWEGRE